jgi:3-oxoacyl-[acyl-carrier protein] reductase
MILQNKTVLVTGASSGIGKAIAIAFSKEGSTVILVYRSNTDSAKEVLEECNKYSKGNVLIQADISNEDSVKEMCANIKEKFSSIDVLINNAGIFNEHDSPTNLEAFQNVYETNFLGPVMVTKYVLDLMKEGKIIFTSSIHGRLGHGRPSAIAYSAFKAALESYIKNLAKELAPNILVNAIAPGRVNTPQWGNPDEKEQDELGQAHLIKRMIQPPEIADGFIFLAKNDAVCGEVLTMDGGMSLVTLG